MARSLASLSLLPICLALAGCPGPETPPDTDSGPGVDAGPVDAPSGIDAPGTDAPGTDAPGSDTPIGMTDAPAPACPTGYPTLASSDFITGLASPVDASQPPNSDDWYVVERAGRIRVADPSGTIVGTFLDIRSTIGPAPTGGNEQGLLGLAFHPDYETNGLFYVAYTPNTGGAGNNIVAVGHRSAGDPRVADAGVTPILTIPDFTWNHNGGSVRFGPDGELYVGTGDGGGGGDPMDNGQDNTQLLGKILRIHVDETTGTSYTIPAGNPFSAPNREEIWATGVRNPWRFSFDRLTGDFWLADVGQDTWEEVDFAAAGTGAGENYGWSDCEGFNRFGGASACTLTGHHPPIVTQRHFGGDPVVGSAVSITGGYVYRGSAIPGLYGAYVFADLAGWVAGLRYCDGTVTDYEELTDLSGDCSGATVGFAEDHEGELYMVCIGSGGSNGTIRRITAP